LLVLILCWCLCFAGATGILGATAEASLLTTAHLATRCRCTRGSLLATAMGSSELASVGFLCATGGHSSSFHSSCLNCHFIQYAKKKME